MKRILFSCTALVLPWTTGCSDGCRDVLVQAVDAPAGGMKAVLFQRDCGATTSFSTQISIIASNEALSGGGNVFVADDDHGAAAGAAWGGPWAELEWLSPTRLLVRYDKNARVFSTIGRQGGIDVVFAKQTARSAGR